MPRGRLDAFCETFEKVTFEKIFFDCVRGQDELLTQRFVLSLELNNYSGFCFTLFPVKLFKKVKQCFVQFFKGVLGNTVLRFDAVQRSYCGEQANNFLCFFHHQLHVLLHSLYFFQHVTLIQHSYLKKII